MCLSTITTIHSRDSAAYGEVRTGYKLVYLRKGEYTAFCYQPTGYRAAKSFYNMIRNLPRNIELYRSEATWNRISMNYDAGFHIFKELPTEDQVLGMFGTSITPDHIVAVKVTYRGTHTEGTQSGVFGAKEICWCTPAAVDVADYVTYTDEYYSHTRETGWQLKHLNTEPQTK